jgi:DNA-binding CsgD family transcriptional regulator
VKLANKKTRPLARRPNGKSSGHANGDVVQPGQPAKRSVARGREDEPDVIAQLSPRQLAVVDLLFKGLSYREISESLGISLFTVRSHLHSAYKKLQVKSRGQAVARILRETSRIPGAPGNGHNFDPLFQANQTIFSGR